MKVGDIVRLRTGSSPQRVVELHLDRQVLRAEYLSNLRWGDEYSRPNRWRPIHDYVLYQEEPLQRLSEIKEKEMSDLYQVKSAPERFGVLLTRNSTGHMVLEMKGENGKVDTFTDAEVELVTPHTVRIRRIGSEGSADLIAEKGIFKKDEMLIDVKAGTIWYVSDIDTKVRGASDGAKLKFVRVQSESVKFGSSE